MKRFAKLIPVITLAFGLVLLLQQSGQGQGVVSPTNLARPDYDYTESNGCTRCHFTNGVLGDHMPEAVGMVFNDTTKQFALTGAGWRASLHAMSNYKSTQNTYCAKCHSPLQAKPESEFKPGGFEEIPDGKVEGITCAACHPSHNAAVVLGRRLGIYKWGMDKSKPEAYTVVNEWHEDELCLNCHVTRHNESNPAFAKMFEIGIKCIDCHMATYGHIPETEVEKRFHDFKVAKNLPYSCGVEGAVTHCHPGYGTESTMTIISYMKEQHKDWRNPKDKTTRRLRTAEDYTALWKSLDAAAAARK